MSELMMSDLYTVNANYPLDSIHMRIHSTTISTFDW